MNWLTEFVDCLTEEAELVIDERIMSAQFFGFNSYLNAHGLVTMSCFPNYFDLCELHICLSEEYLDVYIYQDFTGFGKSRVMSSLYVSQSQSMSGIC